MACKDCEKQQAVVPAVLEYFGVPVTESNLEHFEVFIECLKTHDQRTKAYGTVWKRYGALSNLLSAARKVDRLMEMWWRKGGRPEILHKDALDDAYDGINYLVFMIRNARAGNLTGDE